MEQKAINAVRFLAVDSINKAKSGHPGICLGAAPILTELYANHFKTSISHLDWINRDRFVLSAGHGAPMLYALLHLIGTDLTIEDLKNLRQLGSKTPGHPEIEATKGIDASTGPLGQGIGMGVGFAFAERFLAAKFNKPNYNIFDHYTYVLCGDGDLQEGVAQEALSLAGHYKLNKYIVLYDSNNIQLDGPTNASYTENIQQKYEALGFYYQKVNDGNDYNEISEAIKNAKSQKDKPSIIEIKTTIGYGSELAGTCACHGSPLGEEKATLLRKKLNWEYAPFEVSNDVYEFFRNSIVKRGESLYNSWKKNYTQYKKEYPELAITLKKAMDNDFDSKIDFNYEDGSVEATRNTNGKVISELSKEFPTFIGGSADLTKSTKAKGADGDFTYTNPTGRNICFGVREHAMGAIVNGMTLHGCVRAFSGAFFVFSDYMKPAIRLAALMNIPSIFVFSHDSIAVGEDGPTHEPIEQLAGLRAIPNLHVYRPANANETAYCWQQALASKNTPSVIVLTRQDVINTKVSKDEVAKGAYIIKPESRKMDLCLLACGSEVNLAIEVSKKLENENMGVRVVSMPDMLTFSKQPKTYQRAVLPVKSKVVAIEMSSSMEWYYYANNVYNLREFGSSAPYKVLLSHYKFTADDVTNWIKKL